MESKFFLMLLVTLFACLCMASLSLAQPDAGVCDPQYWDVPDCDYPICCEGNYSLRFFNNEEDPVPMVVWKGNVRRDLWQSRSVRRRHPVASSADLHLEFCFARCFR